jgi:hypothetical protein
MSDYPKMLYRGHVYPTSKELYAALKEPDAIDNTTVHSEEQEIEARENGFVDFTALLKPPIENVKAMKHAIKAA